MSVTKTTTTTTKTGDSDDIKIIEAGENQTQVGKPPIIPTEKEDGVVFNAVGQRVEKKTMDKKDARMNPDGKIVVIQQEAEDKVFVGEIGRNAEWLPKDVVESWPKVKGGEAPKEDKDKKDKNPNDTRYGETVTPSKEEKESAEKGNKAEEKDKEDASKSGSHNKSHEQHY